MGVMRVPLSDSPRSHASSTPCRKHHMRELGHGCGGVSGQLPARAKPHAVDERCEALAPCGCIPSESPRSHASNTPYHATHACACFRSVRARRDNATVRATHARPAEADFCNQRAATNAAVMLRSHAAAVVVQSVVPECGRGLSGMRPQQLLTWCPVTTRARARARARSCVGAR